jgi:outer membrane lipoprotein LolB
MTQAAGAPAHGGERAAVRREGSRATRLLACLAASLLAACAALRPPEAVPVAQPAVLAAPFDVQGRLSARRGNEGGSASFTWTHAGAQDDIALATPLGQTLAELHGDAAGVTARWPDGRTVGAPTFDALIARILGVPVPVQGLGAWLRGYAHPGSAAQVERDAQGRPAVLTQDGWQIVYSYPDDATRRASRLALRYVAGEPADVRVVIDRWG